MSFFVQSFKTSNRSSTILVATLLKLYGHFGSSLNLAQTFGVWPLWRTGGFCRRPVYPVGSAAPRSLGVFVEAGMTSVEALNSRGTPVCHCELWMLIFDDGRVMRKMQTSPMQMTKARKSWSAQRWVIKVWGVTFVVCNEQTSRRSSAGHQAPHSES